MKVLLADDDVIVLKLLEKLLMKWGYETQCFGDGESALKAIEAPGTRPSIAVFDWVMPGIEGLELCRRIKAAPEKGFIYVILLTGRTGESDIVEGLNSGADDYIVKPIKAEELRSRLAVGARSVDYERRLSEFNRTLQEQNGALEKYARIMESLAEERARQLVHAERLSSIGEMAAGIAHEINNYLAPVLGYAEMLAMKLGDSKSLEPERLPVYKGYVENLVKGAQKIRNLVERIRMHSRRLGGGKAPCEINEILSQSLELCENRLKAFKLEKSFAEGLPNILADSQELEQVFVNLLKNAADAMEGRRGSLLKVSSFLDAAGFVVVRVDDSGCGIPEDKLEQIFESFFTTKRPERGTGLGLSISKGIVERHGGAIVALNRKEGGASFVITLPPAPPPASPEP